MLAAKLRETFNIEPQQVSVNAWDDAVGQSHLSLELCFGRLIHKSGLDYVHNLVIEDERKASTIVALTDKCDGHRNLPQSSLVLIDPWRYVPSAPSSTGSGSITISSQVLIQYLFYMPPRKVNREPSPFANHPTGTLFIDAETARNLELVQSSADIRHGYTLYGR